ncbi:GDYXXLXY domain-containing protein [Desulfovibrio sp. OttesenSCG-928-G15]|nr:GDYXXLXY domain-containing protein [Desulfovibrio sp. OttesenSCG-928-G15]
MTNKAKAPDPMTDKLPDSTQEKTGGQTCTAANDTAPPSPLRPFSRSVLYTLAGEQKLDAATLEGALGLLGVRPNAQGWVRYWFHLLCVCGALFLASGIICFIAWNWKGLSHFAKFGILEGFIACGVLVAVWRGTAGPVALTAAGLCMGSLLAVFGQTYMSGAFMWELYRAWACMLLPLALAGGQSGLWLLTWLVASAWGLGYMETVGQNHFLSYAFPEFLLLQIVALCILEFCMYRAQNSACPARHRAWYRAGRPRADWLQSTWLPRLMLLAIVGLTSFVLSIVILEDYYLDPDSTRTLLLPFMPSTAIIYAAGLVALYFWFRYKRRDLFMLGCGLFSLCTLLVVALAARMHMDAGDLLILGLSVTALTAFCGKELLHLHRSMEAEQCAKEDTTAAEAGSVVPGKEAVPGNCTQQDTGAAQSNSAAQENTPEQENANPRLFRFERPVPDWPYFQALLQTNGLWPKDKAFPPPPPAAAPWYISTMLGFGGWVAALLLITCLGTQLYDKLRLNGWSIDTVFLPVGGALILAGAVGSRLPGMFARQFGLVSALAGGVLATSSLVLAGDYRFWPFPCLLICLIGFACVRNATFRFVAAGSCVFFAYYLLSILIRGESNTPLFLYGSYPEMESYFITISRSPVIALLWLALFGFLAIGWHRQSQWIAKGHAQIMNPLLYGIYTCLLLMPAVAKALPFLLSPMSFLLNPRAGLGLAAACGSLLMIYLLGSRPLAGQLPKPLAKMSEQAEQTKQGEQAKPAAVSPPGLYRTSLIAGLFMFPLGWYLPGAAVAMFGFLVSRHIGNTVLFGGTSLFLTVHIIQYYYDLNDTLLQKSYSLVACGVMFLGIAALLRCLFNKGNPRSGSDQNRLAGQPRLRATALLVVLALCFGLFHWAAMQKEALRNGGTTMYLRLAPVDPRAFLLGDYMALNYTLDGRVTDALRSDEQGAADRADGQIVVSLSDTGEASFVRLVDGKTPLNRNEHLLSYRLKNRRAEVAAHAFFFQEGQATDYEKAAYGEIHVDENGKSLLTHLLDENMQRILPEKL